jgi:hypothetical protein
MARAAQGQAKVLDFYGSDMLLQVMTLMGIGHLAGSGFYMFAGVVMVCIVASGWITETVMGQMGLGVMGNAILTLIGIGAALTLWNRYITPVQGTSIIYLSLFCFAVTLVLFLIVMAAKRAMR